MGPAHLDPRIMTSPAALRKPYDHWQSGQARRQIGHQIEIVGIGKDRLRSIAFGSRHGHRYQSLKRSALNSEYRTVCCIDLCPSQS